jgi:hypothetical protein
MQATSRPVSYWGYDAPREQAIEEAHSSSSEASTPPDSPKIVQFNGSISGQSTRATDEIDRLGRLLVNEQARTAVQANLIQELRTKLAEEIEKNRVISAEAPRRAEQAAQQATEAADNHYYQAGQDRQQEASWFEKYRAMSWGSLGLAMVGTAVAVAAIVMQIFRMVK